MVPKKSEDDCESQVLFEFARKTSAGSAAAKPGPRFTTPFLVGMSMGGRRRLVRQDLDSATRRIVIKAGTTVLSRPDGQPAISRIANIVEQISQLRKEGKEVIFVASGAVGIGRQRLDRQRLLNSTLRTHAQGRGIQMGDHPAGACAAAGQLGLMALYDTLFGQFNIACSQVLVLASDFREEERRNTVAANIDALLRLGLVPILNENDAVGAPPDGKIFTDNDSLASLIASEVSADALLLLTDVDGVYDAPPSEPGSTLISEYAPQHTATVKIGALSAMGRGGMASKISAAQGAVDRGVRAVVIASGLRPNSVQNVMRGEVMGTIFNRRSDEPAPPPMSAALPLPPPAADKAAAAAAAAAGVEQMARECRDAGRALAALGTEGRVAILREIAAQLLAQAPAILAANARDIANGGSSLSKALAGRLKLSREKLSNLADGILSIAAQDEPLDRVLGETELAEGLVLQQRTAPIGALLIIFESRPDSMPQIVSLAVRSGNGLLLKGGKEAAESNAAIHRVLVDAIHVGSGGKVPRALVGLVTSRDQISDLLALDGLLDLCIPRGSNELVAHIKANTRIPVLGHGDGVCHVFVDEHADPALALRLVLDAKTDYPSACNAAETVLLHRKHLGTNVAADLLRGLAAAGVAVRAGPAAVAAGLLPASAACEALHTEYGDLTICVEVVDDVVAAVAHANAHGSSHTECIVTQDQANARYFLAAADSACVFHNASTRFADGFRFGLGAEVGISTSRIHARGPVGVEGLLTTKWRLVSSRGHVVGDFAGAQPKLKYTHVKTPLSKL